MSWNYEDYLRRYITDAVRDSGILNEFPFDLCTEQDFLKIGTLTPGRVYVVIKYLSTTNTLQAVTQPIQILVMCEQNQIQDSQAVFGTLVKSHNFEQIIDNGTYVKQDYREPVVLSNFNEVSYGYRSIMYISATLFIMENVIDISDLKINNESVTPINFNIAYSMTPNTQQIPPAKLATSVKSIATFSITFSVPMLSTYTFITTISNIMNGTTTGNTNFDVSFKLGSVKFGYFEENDTHLNMKLVSAQVTTAINEIPGLQIGLLK